MDSELESPLATRSNYQPRNRPQLGALMAHATETIIRKYPDLVAVHMQITCGCFAAFAVGHKKYSYLSMFLTISTSNPSKSNTN